MDIERMLGHADDTVRRDAVLSLADPARIGRDDAVRLLVKAMRDSNWRVRKAAAEIVIEKFQMEAYVKDVINLLNLEDNAGARNSAIEVLVKLGPRAFGALEDAYGSGNEDVRKFIVDILGEVRDRRAAPLLIRALADEDENVKASAVEHLGSLNESSVVDALLEILGKGELWTAYPAVEALGRIGDERAIPALLRALESSPLKEPAVRALGRMGRAVHLDVVIPYLTDKSRAVQHVALKAVEAFYHRGVVDERTLAGALRAHLGESAVPLLSEAASSAQQEVRAPSILLLGLLGDTRAIEPLLALALEDEFSDDVKRALTHIARLDPASVAHVEGRPSITMRFMAGVMAEVADPSYFETFVRLLGDSDGHVRTSAALGLSRMDDPRAVGPISHLIGDPYPDVQDAAVSAMIALCAHLDVTGLAEKIRDSKPSVRRNAVRILTEVDSPEADAAVGFALKDESAEVRKAVVGGLHGWAPERADRLLRLALTDESSDVRIVAIQSVGATRRASLIPLLGMLSTDSDEMVRVAVAKALGAIGSNDGLRFLLTLTDDENGFVMATALSALGSLGGPAASDVLVAALAHPDAEIRRTAIRALGRFPEASDRLVVFLADRDWATRVAAVEALSESTESSIHQRLRKAYATEEDPVVSRALRSVIDALD
jgi:HEAT repeat protein